MPAGGSSLLPFVSRKELDPHARPLARSSRKPERAAVMEDDFSRQRQSQSEAVRLAGLERQQVRGCLSGVDADAVVAHGDDRMRLALDLRIDRSAAVRMPLPHGVDGIAHDVLERPFEQLAVAVDLHRRALEREAEVGGLAAKVIDDRRDDLVEADALRADLERPREIEQRVDRAGELLRLLLRVANLRRRLLGGGALRELQVSENREERVAE